MKKTISHPTFKISAVAIALMCSGLAQADTTEELSKAIKDSKVDVQLRYRVETVDQDGIDEDAFASTLKSRLTVTSGKFNNFSALVEIDDVSNIGNDSYNSTINGKSDYPVVADPVSTEVNQASISFHGDKFTATAGRQRIVLDDQRFVGGVAWRQNEQTYDGYRLKITPTEALTVDASYIVNVNRIFSEKSANSDLHGSIYLVNANYAINKAHKVTGFVYNMDFDNALAASNSTVGVNYDGKFALADNKSVTLHAAYANQSETGDNPTEYSASYLNLEAMANFEKFAVGAGYEVLGSDDGVKAFQTPLATLHKFQGFADKFLATPNDGIQDFYLKATTKIADVALTAVYHDFSADNGDKDWGSELDLVAAYKVNKQISTLVKYANYSADDHGTDTSKLWFMVTATF